LRKKVKTPIVKSTKSPELKQRIQLTHFQIVMAEPLLSQTCQQRQSTPAAWRRALKTRYWTTMICTKSLRLAKKEGRESIKLLPLSNQGTLTEHSLRAETRLRIRGRRKS